MEFISSIFIVISVSVTIIVIITIIVHVYLLIFLFVYSHYGTISTERSQTISATWRMHRDAYYFTLNYLYIFASISNGLDQP